MTHVARLTRIRLPHQPGRVPQCTLPRLWQTALVLALAVFAYGSAVANDNPAQDPAVLQQQAFTDAWQAAAQGKRKEFERLMPGLVDYELYPYLQYEDYRFRRASVADADMAAFLETHEDWAFTAGLEKAWLRTLGKRGRWDALLQYAGDSTDSEVQCYLAQARLQRGQLDGLENVAKSLWTVGESQPDACDPVFSWLRKQGGITSSLAWERINRAMEARQPRLTLYLARFLDPDDQVWAERWYQQDRSGYRQLRQAVNWPDEEESRDITEYGLKRLARSDSDRAWQTYQAIESRFSWTAVQRAGILREIALWSAVEGVDGTPVRMQAVPGEFRDGTLLGWWTRFALTRADWNSVVRVIGQMSSEQGRDARWRYWDAVARLESGETAEAVAALGQLALEANYYGFLAADRLDFPYTICPEDPVVDPAELVVLAEQAGFSRSLELRRAGVVNWARSEWQMAVRSLDPAGLRVAAALAVQNDWPDMAIFALGNSGDLRWYEWRFPVEFAALVETRARERQLDPSWILGLMRSESAMAEDAISPAGARGLMQVMPQTAQKVARRHSVNYSGKQQLMQAGENIELGTFYLRELYDKFSGNPVLATGAYNAGPNAVERWLVDRPAADPAIWVETLPFYETRDYIPRVLAFSTIYEWRMAKPVSRISSRMPEFSSGTGGGNMKPAETAEVVCRTPG